MAIVFTIEKATGSLLIDHIPEQRAHPHMLTNTDEGCTSKRRNTSQEETQYMPMPTETDAA